MPEFDVIIKDGTIFEGVRNHRFRADLGIEDGVIAGMGFLHASDATRVIDASESHVDPRLIDLHTYYDAHLFWDPWCSIPRYYHADVREEEER